MTPNFRQPRTRQILASRVRVRVRVWVKVRMRVRVRVRVRVTQTAWHRALPSSLRRLYLLTWCHFRECHESVSA